MLGGFPKNRIEAMLIDVLVYAGWASNTIGRTKLARLKAIKRCLKKIEKAVDAEIVEAEKPNLILLKNEASQ